MRQTLDLLKAHNEVRIISEPLDIHLEIPHLAYLEVKSLILKHCFLPIQLTNNAILILKSQF